MLDQLKKWWRKPDGSAPVVPVSIPEPLTDSPASVAAEPARSEPLPEPEDIRAGWRPDRIYKNRAERQRVGDNLPSDLGEHREPMKS